MDAVRAEAIRTLFVQARNSAIAALVVTAYMVVAAWDYSDHQVILSWLGLQTLAQLARLALVALFHRRQPKDEALERWALAYTLYMALAGALWGASSFLYMHAEQPITIALTLCGLYGISAGSVPGNAYNPSGVYAFVVTIFGCVLVELTRQREAVYIVLGIASAAFAAILILFCKVQARTILNSFRIRFENQALLEALTQQREAAEQARAEAEQASLTKSQFLAAASHDLRQPLHALGLLAGSLRSLVQTDATQRVVTEMRANIHAMEGLFNGLLDLARLEAGVVQVASEPLPSDELFDRLNHFLKATSLERGIDLRFRSDGAIMHSDPVLIEQIMLNLAANAIHNTERGAVLCAARRRGGTVRLEVWDTGRGIAASELDRIFEAFVQLGNVERDRRRGMGLGLAIAQRSAELLGTTIGVASRPGHGSVFWLSQPVAAKAVAPVPAPPPARAKPDCAERHILVIDDDEAVQRSLDLLFDGWNVQAQIMSTGEQALAALQQGETFSHVLCDYRLPGPHDGIDLLLALRDVSGLPPHRLFLITGDMDAGLIARADNHGLALLHKPLSPEKLQTLLALTPDAIAP
ncbi:MAG: hybrid sensor histidine kinase/response regulator [Sphingobium sp.]|nr:hybrid sensor histidine kinase/response regulator [Sphingobium sp.]